MLRDKRPKGDVFHEKRGGRLVGTVDVDDAVCPCALFFYVDRLYPIC